jgi:hypothetical protein
LKKKTPASANGLQPMSPRPQARRTPGRNF